MSKYDYRTCSTYRIGGRHLLADLLLFTDGAQLPFLTVRPGTLCKVEEIYQKGLVVGMVGDGINEAPAPAAAISALPSAALQTLSWKRLV